MQSVCSCEGFTTVRAWSWMWHSQFFILSSPNSRKGVFRREFSEKQAEHRCRTLSVEVVAVDMDPDAFAAAAAEFKRDSSRDHGSSLHMSFSRFGETSLQDLTRRMASEAAAHRQALFAAACSSHPANRARQEVRCSCTAVWGAAA